MQIWHIKGIETLIHNGPGLLIIILFVFTKDLCSLDGQRAIKVNRYDRE